MPTMDFLEIGDNKAEMPTQAPDFDENCFKQADRDELKHHGWQLANILEALAEIKQTAKEKTNDLESRVRTLENFKWVVWGMGTIIGILFGYIIQLIAAAGLKTH